MIAVYCLWAHYYYTNTCGDFILHRIINIHDAYNLPDPIYIDMRSPSEFEVGHIPGAYSIPLFSDEERAKVGTVYRQDGSEEAKYLGLSIVSTKLPDLVREVRALYQTGRTVIIYCWRGGMRSKSVVNVLDLMGIPAYQLLGGYKSFRNYVLEKLRSFELKPQIVVLCGSTGVGKTKLLSLLAEQGAFTLDLEKLANHRGSAFGHVGIGTPATAQNFDAVILAELEALNDKPYIIVECESKRIGNVYVPDVLFDGMKRGKRILAFADTEIRISRLIEEYAAVYSKNYDAIIGSINTLEKKIGRKQTDLLLAQMEAGQVRDVVRLLLIDYYDPLYGYEKAASSSYNLSVCANDLVQASSKIMDYLHSLGGVNNANSR